ncbi:MAG: T9SS type A sorting domain-containing protein, partial [Flavobacteriales bacterium]|nr:T9SS type A sorting domain-containing protein [Flavobacteriales bacterium]
MKKLYTIASLLLVSSVSFAQLSNTTFPEPTDVSTKILKSKKIFSSIASNATPFWSEDFSGGIPSNWEEGYTLGSASAPWIYRGPSTTPNISTGSQGAYAGTQGPIMSPTASNGFMLFDSDYYDNGGTPGNFGSGQYPANTPASPGHVGTLTTDAIDLSMYSDVTMLFNSFYREFTGIARVAFSIDSGITYTDTMEVHPEIDVNEVTANDYQVKIRLPFNIVGNPDVRIQFIYDGTVLYGSYYGYYFWMIDDIELIETPDNAASITDAVQGGWWVNYANVAGGTLAGFDYTFNTNSQLAINPYSFEAVLYNDGVAAQNMVLNAEVFNDAGTSVFSTTSNPILLNSNYQSDTFVCNNTFTPTVNGVYEMRIWGSGDSVVTDTVVLFSVVSDDIYARDMGEASGSRGVSRSCGGQIVGTTLDIYADETVYALQVYIDDESVVGTPVYVALYENGDPTVAFSPIYLTQSDDYILTPNDLDNWITVPFDGGQDLFAGTSYLAAVGGYANPIDTFLINLSGKSQGATCWIQDNGCNIGSGTFGDWYWLSDIPMIRMSFDLAALSVDHVISGEFNVYPNPNNGVFTVELNNIKADDYRISVTNVLGQEVYTSTKEISTLISEKIDLS